MSGSAQSAVASCVVALCAVHNRQQQQDVRRGDKLPVVCCGPLAVQQALQHASFSSTAVASDADDADVGIPLKPWMLLYSAAACLTSAQRSGGTPAAQSLKTVSGRFNP
jgi:hypothetical protein